MQPAAMFGAAQDLRRLAEVAGVFIAHGFGDLIRQLGLDKTLAGLRHPLRRAGGEVPHTLSAPERLRLALEELGPTFVKLGQVLSTRADLLPPAYIAELGRLRDKVATLDWATLVTEVEAELGAPLAELFAAVDTAPLGAGSIAQVHRARTMAGAEVVLKIRRPGIVPVIETDLRLLLHAATLAEGRDELARFHPVEVATEFARSLRSELDLANECRNAERVAASFAEDPFIRVPAVHWQWTRENMNVQDWVTGLPGSDLGLVRAAGLDLRLLARRGAGAVLKMIFEDRFYHADPHPGNVFYQPDGSITFIDFGMVGLLTRQRRDELVDLLFGVVDKRADKVVDILLRWAEGPEAERAQLAIGIEGFIDSVHGVALKDLDLTAQVSDLIAIVRAHQLALPADLTMLIKAFISLEGMGRELDPDFDIVTMARPFLERLIWQRYAPQELMRLGREGLSEGVELMAELPRELRSLLKAAVAGRLRLQIEVEEAERFLDRLDRLMTRVTLGIVIAALTIGSSIVMTVTGPEFLPVGLSVFALLGFFGAVAGGIWLLWSIWRSR